jgi:hypothetical protein
MTGVAAVEVGLGLGTTSLLVTSPAQPERKATTTNSGTIEKAAARKT